MHLGPNLDRNSYYLLSNRFKHHMSVFLKILFKVCARLFWENWGFADRRFAAAQPQFSQNNLPKTSKKSLKILTYNALVKVAMKKITLCRLEPAYLCSLTHHCTYWAKLDGWENRCNVVFIKTSLYIYVVYIKKKLVKLKGFF